MKYKHIIDKMTLEEKASLMSGKTFWDTRDIEDLGIPSIALSDGPSGIRKQLENADHLGLHAGAPATCYPSSATVANSWDVELAKKVGELLGEEATHYGISVLLGPGLNIKRNPLCGRNFEYFSEDPFLSGKMASGCVTGIQSKGISACPKHFAGNNQEMLRLASNSVIDERALREIYLTGFEIVVKESAPKSIMSAYNKVNGVYANENTHLLQDILVDDWGFNGLIVTDWGGSNDRVDGLIAGNQLEMPGSNGESDDEIVEAVKSGKLSVELLDKRVDELLSIVFECSQFEEYEFNKEKNHKLAGEIAEKCIVLLKNENILPIDSKSKVGVIGDFADKPRYQGAGSSLVNATKLESVLEIVGGRGDINFVGFESGFERNGSKNHDKLNKAIELAKNVDTVLLFIGLDEISEAEGLDRTHMKIADNQVKLINELHKVNKNVVAILSCGVAVEMPWIDKCKGVIHAYLPGQNGAGAILNVVTGKVNPSGKLAETYPVRYSDVPSSNYYPGKEKNAEYRESIFVGYRYYDTANIEPLFPFGFGLSYTEFEYSNIKYSKDVVTFNIKNVGKVKGAEVAQLYVSKKASEIVRADKELKGFVKVELEPNEERLVSIQLDDMAYRYFDVFSNKFEIESGDYEILVGSSSKDIRLSETITVGGKQCKPQIDVECYYKADVKNVTDKQFENILGVKLESPNWDRTQLLTVNDTISQLVYAKSGLARLVYKVINNKRVSSEKKGQPDLNILFIYNMPFRGIAKMTGGIISKDMTNDLVNMANGNVGSGLVSLVKHYLAKNKRAKIRKQNLEKAKLNRTKGV